MAHYSCGGIPTDLRGATQLPGLFAVGEVACTGVHGANRPASNSLLEAVVFSQAVAETLQKSLPIDASVEIDEKIPLSPPSFAMEPMEQVRAYGQRIGQIMWKHAGIVRSKGGLETAKKEIESIPVRDYRVQHRQLVAYKIIQACLARPVSLGCHYVTEELV